MSSTSEWLHFHPNNNTNNTPSLEQVAPSYAATSPSDLFFTGRASEPPVVSTVVSPIQPSQARSGPDGRVSKPVRRRTRASRRTPTTLLNTDASNFRAMVQQFTGGPSIAFPSQNPPVFSVGPGLGYGLQQYGGASNSSPINTKMFMQRNNIEDYNSYNAYVQNNTGSMNNNNNNMNAGSSSSENRSSNNNNNNFQF